MDTNGKYKIAVASSDGEKIDLGFGEALEFIIYEVDGEEYGLLEKRQSSDAGELQERAGLHNGCGSHQGTGCKGGNDPRIELLSDCRCVICKKIGFGIQKAFERKGISSFDIDGDVNEALKKITSYIYKLDNHISLRRQ